MKNWTSVVVIGCAIATSVLAADLKVATLDNCDPNDPAWGANGCLLKVKQGDVTRAEFILLLISPLSAAVVGHPSWRMEPSYISIGLGKTVELSNGGGRGHTFTEVANFGGGFVPPLNAGLTQAPECIATTPAPTVLAPGQKMNLTGLAAGEHKFQCCIHPWMRAVIKVNDVDKEK